jgi:hypothetical protein
VALTKGLNRTAIRALDPVDRESQFGIVAFTLFQDEGTCFTASNAFEVRKINLSSPSALILQKNAVEAPGKDESDSVHEETHVEENANESWLAPITWAEYNRGLDIGATIEAEYFDDDETAKWYLGTCSGQNDDEYEVDFDWGVETVSPSPGILGFAGRRKGKNPGQKGQEAFQK